MAMFSSMVPLGTPLPAFALPSIDGGRFGADGAAGAPALLVAFLSNHCPYVRHIESALGTVAEQYAGRGVLTVGICSNDTGTHPDDGVEGLTDQARRAGFGFRYLVDGNQDVARLFRAACTPDLFLYDAHGRLAYRGEFDDARPRNREPVTGAALRSALDHVLAGRAVPEPHTPAMGCGIKWAPGTGPP